MHKDLLTSFGDSSGLIVVTGPTGQGKTTAIEAALADAACPPNIVFVGDVHDTELALRAIELARSQVVVAVLRIQRAAGAFVRLIDMGAKADDVAAVIRVAFTTRLFRSPMTLLHERLVVSDAIRRLIRAGADSDAVHRLAIAEGMRSLRQRGLGQVHERLLTREAVLYMTPED